MVPGLAAAPTSHTAGVFSVAAEGHVLLNLRLHLRLWQSPNVLTLGETQRHDSSLGLIVCGLLRVYGQTPVALLAAIRTVAVSVHASFSVWPSFCQQRSHSMWRTWWGNQEGSTGLTHVGSDPVLTSDVAGEGVPVGLIEEGVDQRVDSRGDVTNPHENVEKVIEEGLVTGATTQDEGDVGDEEGTPHDEEEEENDSQNLEEEKERAAVCVSALLGTCAPVQTPNLFFTLWHHPDSAPFPRLTLEARLSFLMACIIPRRPCPEESPRLDPVTGELSWEAASELGMMLILSEGEGLSRTLGSAPLIKLRVFLLLWGGKGFGSGGGTKDTSRK